MKKRPKPHTNKSLKCGSCTWFWNADPGTGENCRESRKVKKKDTACQEYDEHPFSPRILKLSDKFVRKIRKQLESPQFNVDESIVDELHGYFIFAKFDSVKNRILRRVPSSFERKSLEKLAKLLEETQANRDRVTEIKISLYGFRASLMQLKGACENYMYDWYMEDINALRNEAARNGAIRSIFAELFSKIDAVDHILNVAETVDKNLTNTYFSLKEIRELASSLMEKEHRHV